MKKLLLILLILISTSTAYSQAGTNDSTFNSIDIGFGNGDGPNNKIMCSAQQSDGKIIIGGAFTTYNGTPINRIARLNIDGSLDMSFNVGTGANNIVKTIAIQSNGKILIGGSFTTYNGDNSQHIVRLNIDGTKDTTFVSGPGNIDNDINVIAITPDGNLAIGGKFTQYLGYGLRYFAFLYADGTVNGPAIAARADNEINAIAVQSNGKIVLGGSFTTIQNISRNKIARLNADGTLDTSFVPAGTGSNIGANNTVNAVAIQTDGKILIGGYFTSYAGNSANKITRLNSNGGKDLSFNPGSGVQFDDGTGTTDSAYTAIFSIVIKSNGNILIGGNFNRYNGNNCSNFVQLYSDGSKEQSYCFNGTSFNITGLSIVPNSTTFVEAVRTILLQNDGKTIIAGNFGSLYFHNYIARFNEGTEDFSFNTGTGASFSNNGNSALTNLQATITDIAIQPDNKSIITGRFRYYNGVAANSIARLNQDGSKDNSFDTSALNVAYNNTSQLNKKIALQNDGKVLLYCYPNLIRLNSNGSQDTSFNPTIAGYAVIYDIKVLPNGKILIGGDFTAVNGIAVKCIARLNGDGSLDTSFNALQNQLVGSLNSIQTICVFQDGRIVVGGIFNNVNRQYILDSNGGYVTTYACGTGQVNGRINDIEKFGDESHCIIVGNFTQLCNTGTNSHIFKQKSYTSPSFALPVLAQDNSFHSGVTDGNINKALIQCDNKIIILGNFTTFDGVARNGIARLNEDGTLDTTFNIGTGANTINAIVQQNDGKLIIGGAFTSYNGIGRNRVARLNNDITIGNVIPVDYNIGNITNDGTPAVCPGDSRTYTVPPVNGATSYLWSVPSNGTIITNNGNSIVVNYNQISTTAGYLTVRGINNCGGSSSTRTIEVYLPFTPTPNGTSPQTFTQGQRLSNLQVTGTNLKWYATLSDATNHINPIASSTLLVNGTTYYVTRTNVSSISCESLPLAITVTLPLGLNDLQKDKFIYYPNPVSSVVNFENNNPILKITLFNLLGQRVEEKEINSLSGQLDMSKLPSGNYLLKFKTDNGESIIKLVRK